MEVLSEAVSFSSETSNWAASLGRRLKIDNELVSFQEEEDILFGLLSLFCVTCAALAAGLTVGLLSMDSIKLKIKLQVGTESEKACAKKILPIIKDHHLLLCTLLFFNALANEALPIFLDELLPSWAAVVLSVTLVLICGEVIPSALFTGPNQLKIAAKFIGLVWFLECIFYPIAYPMAKLLDYILGHEEDDNFNRDEISAFVQIIRNNRMEHDHNGQNEVDYNTKMNASGQPKVPNSQSNNDNPLTHQEVNVITGVLNLTKLTAGNVCIPYLSVNMLSIDQVLDQATIDTIDQVGHSRLPVFKGPPEARDVIGYLLVKRLVKINPEKAIPLRNLLPLQDPIVISSDKTLLEVMSIFQSSQGHMALVSNFSDELEESMKRGSPPTTRSAPIGILTIEDVFEHMIQAQIYDEKDFLERESASVTLREMSHSYSLRSSVDALAGIGSLPDDEIENPMTASRGIYISQQPPNRVNSIAKSPKNNDIAIDIGLFNGEESGDSDGNNVVGQWSDDEEDEVERNTAANQGGIVNSNCFPPKVISETFGGGQSKSSSRRRYKGFGQAFQPYADSEAGYAPLLNADSEHGSVYENADSNSIRVSNKSRSKSSSTPSDAAIDTRMSRSKSSLPPLIDGGRDGKTNRKSSDGKGGRDIFGQNSGSNSRTRSNGSADGNKERGNRNSDEGVAYNFLATKGLTASMVANYIKNRNHL